MASFRWRERNGTGFIVLFCCHSDATFKSLSLPSSHFFDLSTARCHPCHFLSLAVSSNEGLNSVLPFVFTSAIVSGLVMSQPNRPIAEPANSAEPRAVDLRNRNPVSCIYANSFTNVLSHLRSNDRKASNVSQHLHGHISVCHTPIYLEMFQFNTGVTFHAFNDCASLESVRF